MRRFLTCAALAALVLIGVSCAQVPPAPPGVDARILDASVVIMRSRISDVTDESGNALAELSLTPRCGGVAIGPHLIVTAQHCVVGNYVETIFFATREQWFKTASGAYSGAVVKQDAATDLALIETTATLPFLPSRTAHDEPALMVRPLRSFSVTHVSVGESRHIDSPIERGDSGSPIIAASDSAVLGLVSSCWADVSGDGSCNPARGFERTSAQWP